jgi:DNA-binding transcriptional regulator YiaG
VRRLRERLRLTQVALAERLGVKVTTLARWERNEVPVSELAARFLLLLAKTEKRRRG